METPSEIARRSWRAALHEYLVRVFLEGRDRRVCYVVPAHNFAIAEIEEVRSWADLPPEGFALRELPDWRMEPAPRAVEFPVDPETGELLGSPRLRPRAAALADELADRMLADAWAVAMRRSLRGER